MAEIQIICSVLADINYQFSYKQSMSVEDIGRSSENILKGEHVYHRRPIFTDDPYPHQNYGHSLRKSVLVDLSSQKKQCKVCCVFKSTYYLVPFCCQSHYYCVKCIENILQEGVKSFRVIKCPEEDCEVQFNQKSPYFIHTNKDLLKKIKKLLKNKSILQDPTAKLCSKQQCDGQIKLDAQIIQCTVCKQQYCKKCHDFTHAGKCDKIIANQILREHRFKKCPHCKMLVQKNEGCNHMTCICQHQFCYTCGATYKQNHVCTAPQHFTGMQSLRWIYQQPNLDDYIDLAYILLVLEPNQDKSQQSKCLYIVLFSATLYPLLLAIVLPLCLIAYVFVSSFLLLMVIIYFILLPIVQVVNLSLSLSRLLIDVGIPKLLIRVFVIPLYPIYFITGIVDKAPQFLRGRAPVLKRLRRIMQFFMMLPCLMTVEQIMED